LKHIQTYICEKKLKCILENVSEIFSVLYTLPFMFRNTTLCFYHYGTDVFDGLERYFPLLFAHRSLMAETCIWSSFWPLIVFLGIWCLCCQPVHLIVKKQVVVMLFVC